MIAATTNENIAAKSTKPAAMSFIAFISGSISDVMRLQILSMAVLTISDMKTKAIARPIHNHSFASILR